MKKLLLLCNRPPKGTNADTIIDHLDALDQLPGFEVFELSTIKSLPNRLDLKFFDVIVIHYTLQLGEPHNHFLSGKSRLRIAASTALKVAFIQDEYREVERVRNALRSMSVRVLFTLLNKEDCQTVYPKTALPDLTTVRVLAGYVPNALLLEPPRKISSRPIDVSYRARKMPIWLGKLAAEKWTIAKDFVQHVGFSSHAHGLKFDISTSEADRLYANQWVDLLSKSKCVLGVESGSNVLDLDGNIRIAVEKEVNKQIKDDSQIYKEYVQQSDGLLNMNQISPRHLECCALGTVQILFEGNYSGILKAGRHYIELKKDYSNILEVIEKIQDYEYLQKISDTARSEIADNPQYGYVAMAELVANSIAEHMPLDQRSNVDAASPRKYNSFNFHLSLLLSANYIIPRTVAMIFNSLLKINILRGFLFHIWYQLSPSTQSNLRPLLILLGR